MSSKKTTKKPTTRTSAARNSSTSFTKEERAAMRERARELKSKDGETDLLEAIAKMPPQDRAMAKKIHSIVTAAAPVLAPKTWYGMPAYAKDGKVVCFFQGREKFKSRYATFGFSDEASLDKNGMWPTSFALMQLTDAEEGKIAALVKKAVR